jgi:hypothetical protein
LHVRSIEFFLSKERNMIKKQSKKATKTATSLVLRVCRSDMSSRSGFSWTSEVGAEVSAPDWKNNKECGNGLHGWLYGQGDHSCVSYCEDAEAKWMVLEVPSADIVMLGGRCKFPSAVVRFIGTKSAAADFILANEPKALNVAVIGACLKVGDGEVVQVGGLGTATAGESGTATAGYRGTATAGYRGTATAGNYGTATAGYRGTATAGNYGTATAGIYGTATAGYRGTATAGESGTPTAGNYGTATAGNYGTPTAGNYGTATAGNYGTPTAGNYGTATAGNYGTATAGYRGTATAGNYGTATAGERGELRIQWWDDKASRYRTVLGYVGENGIKADTAYRLNDKHEFEEVK